MNEGWWYFPKWYGSKTKGLCLEFIHSFPTNRFIRPKTNLDRGLTCSPLSHHPGIQGDWILFWMSFGFVALVAYKPCGSLELTITALGLCPRFVYQEDSQLDYNQMSLRSLGRTVYSQSFFLEITATGHMCSSHWVSSRWSSYQAWVKRDPCLFKHPVCLPATDEQRGRSLTFLIMEEDTDLGTRTCGEFGILRHVDCWGNLRATYSHESLHLLKAFALGTVLGFLLL